MRAAVTPVRPERRMLERPPAVDEVAGLERFRCEPFSCVLTRRACAGLWRNATKLRRTGGGLVAAGEKGRPHAAMAAQIATACRGCPVGEIHAREERARPGVQLRVVRAEPPPPTTPPQVQPAPAPSPAAGLQPRLDLRDAARAGAETSPAEAPPASPPGPATSAGLRPTDDDCSDDQEGQQQEEDTMATTTKTTKRAEPTTTATASVPARASGGQGGPPRTLTYQGKTQTIRAWADELGLTDAAIRMRLLKGLPIERVLGPRLEGGPPRSSKAEKAARPPQRPQRRASKASTPKRPAPAPRPPDGRVEAPTTLVVPAAPRHPAVELLEAVGYHVRQLAAPAGVVLLVQEATG